MIAIPTIPDGGNHTPAFAEAAATEKAHEVCLNTSKALAAVGMRVLTDDMFLAKASRMSIHGCHANDRQVKHAFEEGKAARGE